MGTRGERNGAGILDVAEKRSGTVTAMEIQNNHPSLTASGTARVAHLDVAINVELKWSVTKVGNDMIARSLESDGWVDLDLGFPQVETSERNALELSANVRQVPQQESQRTEHFAILGKHGLALSEIDQATDCVARTKLGPVGLTYVLGGETVTVIAMVAP